MAGETIAVAVVEKVVDCLVAPVGRQFGYVFNYDDNIANLRSLDEQLEVKRADLQPRVDAAERNSYIITREVSEWRVKAVEKKAEAEQILNKANEIGNGCFNRWCLNLKPRYSSSRSATKKARELVELLDGSVFDTIINPKVPLGVEPVPHKDISGKFRVEEEDAKTKIIASKKMQLGETSTSVQNVPKEEIPASKSAASANVGVESRISLLNDVMEAVRDKQVRIVRICGMGGVGKTTMAEEVKKIASVEGLFNEIPMVRFNKEPDHKIVQLHIAQLLGLELKEDSLSERAYRLRQRLNDEKYQTLIILDNVWSRDDVEKVGIPLEDENNCCKILLTSRLNLVCKNIATHEREFDVETLSNPEALIVFHQCLGNAPCYDQKAEELVKACSGLPLAIKTVAQAVANKSENSWTVAIEELHKSALEGENPDVFYCLKMSYDFLKTEEIKKIFRRCCLFQKGLDVLIEDLARYGMALRLFQDTDKLYMARNKAYCNVETLVHSNLLLGGDKKDCVRIHDLVWDFSVSISSNGRFMVNHGVALTEWPRRDSYEDYTSISLRCSKMDEVPEGLNCRNLKLLQLTGSGQDTHLLKFPETFYEGMGGLNVLSFRSMNVPLNPNSLKLVASLRTLSLERCCLDDDVSIIGSLGNLEVLSFASSSLKELPIEIRNLRRLRLLDLTSCFSLDIIVPGVLSCLICLEELYMRDTDLWRRNKPQAVYTEIASLSKLVVIDIEIPLEFLPMDSLFKKLKQFKITIEKYASSSSPNKSI